MTQRAVFFALAAAAAALSLVPGCSTTRQDRGAPSSTPTPAPTTFTSTRTQTSSPTSTATRTITYTPSVTNAATITYTPSDTPTPCGTAACTPANASGYVLISTYLIQPAQTPQTGPPSSFNTGEWDRYDFCATAGVTYTFSACQYGGAYSSDSYFELFDGSCNWETDDDDTCSLGSEIVWTSSFTGPAILQVHGFSWQAESYTLAYWHN